MDGECVGEVLHGFDLLALGNEDYRSFSYQERYAALLNLLCSGMQRQIQFVQGYSDPHDKMDVLQQLKDQKAEGVVFKRLDAVYTPGRPNSGGPQLKYKFYATGSFIVASINTQRSIALRLFGTAETCGNVTIPPNQPIPNVGAIVDIRYLYVQKEGGSLYQPVYLGERDDLDQSACTADQLKYKAVEDDES